MSWLLFPATKRTFELGSLALQRSSSLPSGQSAFPLQILPNGRHWPLWHWNASGGHLVASWQPSSSLPSSQFRNLSQTKKRDIHWPLRHWKVSLWQPVEFAEQLRLGRTHSQTPARQSLNLSASWHSSRLEQLLPSELGLNFTAGRVEIADVSGLATAWLRRPVSETSDSMNLLYSLRRPFSSNPEARA